MPEDANETSATAAGAERKKLVARAGVVGLGTLLSRLLGLARDMALAAVFPKALTDAFFVAFTIPNALRQLLGEGAVSSAVVPVLSERRASGGEAAGQDFFRKARGVSLLALTLVTVLGMLFARPLTGLFAAGYRHDEVQFERTVTLTRVVFPYIFFMGTAALGAAALNAQRRFAVAAFAPGLLNVAFLLTTFGLPAWLATHGHDPAVAMGAGALLGGVLQMVAQWPALRAIGYAAAPRLALADPHVRTMLRRLVPMMAGIGVYYVDLVLSRRFLSELGEGAQSYFSWASRICDFPQGIFVMALSTASLPSLTELAAKRDYGELKKTYAYGLRLGLFVAIPCSVGLVCLAEPATALLLQRGKFSAEDAAQTARALALQGAGIFTVAAVRQTVPVFHALGDTRTPVLVSAADLVVFIVLAVVLRGRFGHAGISAAIAGSSAAQMLMLFAALNARIGDFGLADVVRSACRVLAASVLAGVAGWGAATLTTRQLALWDVGAPWGGGMAGLSAFGLVFVLASWGLGCEEWQPVFGGVARRFVLRRRS